MSRSRTSNKVSISVWGGGPGVPIREVASGTLGIAHHREDGALVLSFKLKRGRWPRTYVIYLQPAAARAVREGFTS